MGWAPRRTAASSRRMKPNHGLAPGAATTNTTRPVRRPVFLARTSATSPARPLPPRSSGRLVDLRRGPAHLDPATGRRRGRGGPEGNAPGPSTVPCCERRAWAVAHRAAPARQLAGPASLRPEAGREPAARVGITPNVEQGAGSVAIDLDGDLLVGHQHAAAPSGAVDSLRVGQEVLWGDGGDAAEVSGARVVNRACLQRALYPSVVVDVDYPHAVTLVSRVSLPETSVLPMTSLFTRSLGSRVPCQ